MFGIAMPPVFQTGSDGVAEALVSIAVLLVGAIAWIWTVARPRRPAESATVHHMASEGSRAA